MKKTMKTIVSLCLCGSLAAGGAGVRALAAGGGAPASAGPVRTAAQTGQISRAPQAAERDETVYVLTGPQGAVEKVIVSSWLKNTAGSGKLRDEARLEGAESVKEDASWTLEDGVRVWDAQGRDIYAQGTSDQPLPVDMTVSYTLDGRAVTPEELAGRSGRVTVRFDYENRTGRRMAAGGGEEEIYVPFALATAAVLDSGRFTNVEVSNGRVLSDGDRTVAVGLAFPGLGENLNLDPEKLEIPDYVEITADVTDFRLESTYTVASSGLFEELDTEDWEDAGDLKASLEEMSEAMDRLLEGSGTLYDGLCTLLEKSGALAEGAEKLEAGAGAVKTGAASLEAGAAQLQTGAASLRSGLETLDGSSAALNAGAEQVFASLLAAAEQQLEAAGAALPAKLTAENYGTILDGVAAALPEAAAEPVVGLKASLDSYNQFYQGLRGYTAGVAQAAEGAGTLLEGAAALHSGAAQLSGGAAELYSGAAALDGSVPGLLEGVTSLRDGAGTLRDGLETFRREAVQRLVDAVDGDLTELADRLEASAEAARAYRSFSGGGEAESQVKFIYRTAPVE